MAEITRYPFVRHLRADASSHVLLFRKARLRRSGVGLSFWFRPFSASVAELPVDDREVTLSFRGRSADFQDVMVQGTLTYRVTDAPRLAQRVDFSVDLRTGALLRQPLERIALLLSQLAQQHAITHIQRTPVQGFLSSGYEVVRTAVERALSADATLAEMGLAVVSVRVSSIRPTPELEKALEATVRERIQQEADEAAFGRRAAAVEKERAIQENELQNRIELAKREEQLLRQQGENQRRVAEARAEAARIEAASEAERSRLRAEAEAAGVREVEGARVAVEKERMAALEGVPPSVLAALAAQKLAGRLRRIEHVNVSPDLLGPVLAQLAGAAERKLGAK
jgi:regulator of protease activity HflC (stomatin/prohibitin superfamily)